MLWTNNYANQSRVVVSQPGSAAAGLAVRYISGPVRKDTYKGLMPPLLSL